jgi:hypothetical protein
MNQQTLRTAIVAFAIGTPAVLPLEALAQAPPCHPQALAGLYVFSASGHTISSGVAVPKAIVEMIRFNGDGTLSVESATVSINGAITQVPPGGTGFYALDADCRGTLTFTPGPSFDLVASPLGREAWLIQTNPNNVLQGVVKKIAP